MQIYYGHHKCASTWITQILAELCRKTGMAHRLVLDRLTPLARGPLTDYHHVFEREEIGEYLLSSGAEMVSCITADMAQARELAQYRGFHVIRDPRDIIVSAYYSHRNSHAVDGLPHLREHRARLQASSLADGLKLEIDFSRQEILSIADWDYNQPNVLEVRMEELTERPYEGFLDIYNFLGLIGEVEPTQFIAEFRVYVKETLNRLSSKSERVRFARRPMKATGKMILGTVYGQRFESNAAGRKPGDTDEFSHYRKGVSGDWVNHFTPTVIDAFQETYGDLLTRLGYETDEKWVDRAAEQLAVPDRLGLGGF